jgi:hypothetical protein
MTYIITARTENSILMASDSRLNYFEDKVINGQKSQEIIAIADCIEKTFFIESAQIGIQFLGIGYFPDNGENYPLSHFIHKMEKLDFKNEFDADSKKIFDFLLKMSEENNTGKYIKGVMSWFNKNNSYIASFNTFNNQFDVQQIYPGQFIDSESNVKSLPVAEKETIKDIKSRIRDKEKEKWWTIGGSIDILQIKAESYEFIEKNTDIFDGTQKELLDSFKNNIKKINGKILDIPKIVKYSL